MCLLTPTGRAPHSLKRQQRKTLFVKSEPLPALPNFELIDVDTFFEGT